MMRTRPPVVVLLLFPLLAVCAPHLSGQDHLSIQIVSEGDRWVPRWVDAGESARSVTDETALKLVVRCQRPLDCRGIDVVAVGQEGAWFRPPDDPATRDSAVWQAVSPARARLAAVAVYHAGRRIGRLIVDPQARTEGETTNVAGLPVSECRTDPSWRYRPGRDHAIMVVQANGSLLHSSAREIDELDSLTVYVRGAPEVIRNLRIWRSSAMRDAVGFSVAGQGTVIAIDARAFGPDVGCLEAHAVVKDFAPGAGVVSVGVLRETNGEYRTATLSTFEVPVLPMHHAGLSLGVIRSDLADPSFQPVGPDSTVSEIGGGRRHLYTVLLTPFVLGRRNVTRSSHPLYLRISPTIGAVLNDITDNALVGLTVDLPAGTYLTVGRHYGAVTRLAGNGPRLGENLAGTGRTITTETRWEGATFWSFSVDLRAAATLLNAARGR